MGVTAVKAAQENDFALFAGLGAFWLVVGGVAYAIAYGVERWWGKPIPAAAAIRLACLLWFVVALALGVPTLAMLLSWR
jgi:hypothetical protein